MAGYVFGRSSASHGFEIAAPMRIKKRKNLDTQAARAPTVTAEGWHPESPTPCAYANTSWAVTWSGGLPSRPKKSCNIRE